jgi:CheY-like chemotaxis protein
VEFKPEKPAVATTREELIQGLPAAGERPILVVEDNPLAANLMSMWLSEAGYNVQIASTGEEALQKAVTLCPAVITLDILLPQMDGWRVLHRLKEMPETKDTPIIVVSIVEDKSFGLSLGAVDYMIKPVSRSNLISKIERLTKSGRRFHRVLVIDDNPADISLVEEILQLDGYEVLKATSGVDGLKAARDEKPDLVILDLMMPDLDGFDVMRLLESDEATRGLPIILFTAKDLTQIERANLGTNIHDIFGKTQLDRDSFRQKIAELLTSSQPEGSGLLAARKARPDLILMDMHLPGLDGYEATRIIKADETLKNIPVIAVTAITERTDEERVRACGCEGFIAKPVDTRSLATQINEFLKPGGKAQ